MLCHVKISFLVKEKAEFASFSLHPSLFPPSFPSSTVVEADWMHTVWDSTIPPDRVLHKQNPVPLTSNTSCAHIHTYT